MQTNTRHLLLVIAVIAIVGTITYLEGQKVSPVFTGETISLGQSVEEKAAQYPPAQEIVNPSGYLNAEPFSLADHIGKKVILVDFWTYSCINCQRTLPYITAWDEKYRDQGLLIVGMHTPEFEFEKDPANVQRAIDQFGIKYPVVQDNDYSTWRAYKNRYWPRKYIIDIDGYIVYDHIGEGAYEETEKVIQRLLQERKEKLGHDMDISTETVNVEADTPTRSVRISPETYFGAWRNDTLGNGTPRKEGVQNFVLPEQLEENRPYFEGQWNVQQEYITTSEAGAKLVFNYTAKNVFMVAQAPEGATITILRDGEPVKEAVGASVKDGKVFIEGSELYHLISEPNGAEQHQLEIIVNDPGVELFTFTFG